MVHVYSLSTQKAEARGSLEFNTSLGYSKFKASLNYIARPCLKKQK